jgi:allantoinase
MDHELYRFSALPLRPRFQWPNGASAAFHVTLTIEHWELTPPPGSVKDQRFLSEFGPYEPDYRTWTQREYGNRVGIFRVLDMLDRHAIRASVAIGASACERYPALVAEVTRRGFEVLAHGTHATRIISSKMTDAEQRATIAASIEAVTRATGSTPKGWLSQDQGEAQNTPALLAEAGIDYLVDWSNDDQAYLMHPGLVSIPHQIEWDDIVLFWLRRVETWRYPDLVEEAARRLADEGAISGRNFGLSIHPWLFGMAHRIRYLDEALRRLRNIDGLWQATTGEIAAWARGQLAAGKRPTRAASRPAGE